MAIMAARICVSVMLRRIAGEQRLDVERLWRHDDEVDAVARNVHAGKLVDDFIHLRDDDSSLEGGRFDDGG